MKKHQEVKSKPFYKNYIFWVAVTVTSVMGILTTVGVQGAKADRYLQEVTTGTDSPKLESLELLDFIDEASNLKSEAPPLGRWSGYLNVLDNERAIYSQSLIDITFNEGGSFVAKYDFYAKGDIYFSAIAEGIYEIKGKTISMNVTRGKKGFFGKSGKIVLLMQANKEILLRGVFASHEEQALSLKKVKDENLDSEEAVGAAGTEEDPVIAIEKSLDNSLQYSEDDKNDEIDIKNVKSSDIKGSNGDVLTIHTK